MISKSLKFSLLLAASLMGSSTALLAEGETDLERAQAKIIELQSDKIRLMEKVSKQHKSGGICYVTSDECTRDRDQLNGKFGILSHATLTLKADCQYEVSTEGLCKGRDYMLRVYVRVD